ncbi:uncharacterized protein PGTG_01648 [Puccinia graminis f. sp. tritici CRL 75-36-700-3]|uniref:Uncharacterized protein n=1 Tax=Puccinia graminis f. sp. tritici (strain CRL 75-36-700-3 / race SCCL) TaxID=418459 RepID=E3JSN0_PUCGT|nr:uncharacterized protein PGTG_01648 [Puccinia graminis f. sp. tritici CRL 75-36-700-3]EFP75055.1 hypothetical protein PGTG_01648 [Puccinia graminis f. sp. tritici CRL 75-36-700-3]
MDLIPACQEEPLLRNILYCKRGLAEALKEPLQHSLMSDYAYTMGRYFLFDPVGLTAQSQTGLRQPNSPDPLVGPTLPTCFAKEEKKTSAPMEPTKRSSTPDAGPTVVVAPKQSITPNVSSRAQITEESHNQDTPESSPDPQNQSGIPSSTAPMDNIISQTETPQP